MIEPELAYMPWGATDSEAMIFKILVTDIKNEIGILIGTQGTSVNINSFKYADMAQEYNETNGIKVDPISYNLGLQYYYNLNIKDSSKVLVTDDIDYFRDPYKDCLYKNHDENISRVIYSKCCSFEKAWCEIDWGDGTVENIDDIINHYEDEVISYDRIVYNVQNIKYHTYPKTGEYYIKIKGRIPQLQFVRNSLSSSHFEYITPKLEEIIQWGNLHLYSISGWLYDFQLVDNNYQIIKIKMPNHISTNSFKELLSASSMFSNLDINENDISQEILFNFVDTFPNLLDASNMFYRCNISYIPKYFCYNHKNIMSCSTMFYSNPITYIGEMAFANCDNLTTVNDLTYNEYRANGNRLLPMLTKVEDGIFENDINLLNVFGAFNYVDYRDTSLTYTNDNIGLKTVGNNIYKNCKRLRHANEPFYQQAGLVSVGESLFENCEDLISVSMCFYKCFSLQYIGDNIFKGCTKIRTYELFCYEDYLVNFPDKMFYDLKYYDYLKNAGSCLSFNGYWENIEEQNGYIIGGNNDNDSTLTSFLKFKSYNHDNFPTRKHSTNLFSKEYIADCINNNISLNGLIGTSNTVFNSLIQFNNKISEHYKETYLISNFTGKAFPIWEYPELINTNNTLFGFRNIKVKRTQYSTVQGSQEYGVSINHYDNYLDIATADPMICYIYPEGGHSYQPQNYLLSGYYLPDEYETEYEKQEVVEFNDPVKYINVKKDGESK